MVERSIYEAYEWVLSFYSKALVRMPPPKGRKEDWHRVWYLREMDVGDEDEDLPFPARLYW